MAIFLGPDSGVSSKNTQFSASLNFKRWVQIRRNSHFFELLFSFFFLFFLFSPLFQPFLTTNEQFRDTRIEEIFAIFASWAFVEKSIGHLVEIFGERFSDTAEVIPEVKITLNLTGYGTSYGNSMKGYHVSEMVCKTNESELPLVWLIIEAGTFTLALFLYLNTRNRVQIHSKIRHFFT